MGKYIFYLCEKLSQKKEAFIKSYTLLAVLVFGFLPQVSFTQSGEKLLIPKIGTIYTSTPRQVVKEITASAYLFESQNDFNRDNKDEMIVGANCVEEFCLNFIFETLHNRRVKFVGTAHFHREFYELVWGKNQKWADVIFFKQENVGPRLCGSIYLSVYYWL